MTVYRAIARFLALTLLVIPLAAESAASLDILDTIAGLPTEIIIAGTDSHQSYTGSLKGPHNLSYTFSCGAGSDGKATCHIAGSHLTQAGSYTVSVVPGNITGTFNVLPDRIDPKSSAITADNQTITVMLMDQYRNPLAGRPVNILSNKGDDHIVAITDQTNISGVQQFALTASSAGARTIRAVDLLSNETLDAVVNMEVAGQPSPNPPTHAMLPASFSPKRSGRMFYGQVASFDIVDHFEVSVPTTMKTGEEAQKIVIRAVDRRGNTVEDYIGNVVFSSTDPLAALPAFGEYTFRDRDLGVREFPLALKFQTPGEQTFRVEDKTNPDIFGEASVLVGGSMAIPTERKIIITSHKQDQAINTTNIILQGKAPPFINLIVTGGQTDQMGETDQSGFFSIPIDLPVNQRDFTIRIRDENNQHDSGSFHLVLDTDGPPIHSMTFSPESPEEGTNVLLVVDSEVGLAQATMTLEKTDGTVLEITLSSHPSASGSYQAVFQAPAAGTYQPTIRVIDVGGNATELHTMFIVKLAGLDAVENIKTTPQKNSVALEWDPCKDVDGYRIYVGEKPEDFLYSLDTGRPTTKATVSGLLPGRRYYFAVTCLIGDIESETKNIIDALIPGLVLTITPQDSSLLIEWPALPTDIPLDSFLLEYGIEPNNLTEHRTLHGSLNAFTLHDLLNDITYYLRLTPISVTGETLKDMTASGQGTPHALVPGFRPRPADAIPAYPNTLRPIGASVLPHAPATHPTGIPTFTWISAGLLAFLIGSFALRHRKWRQETIFLKQLQQRYQ